MATGGPSLGPRTVTNILVPDSEYRYNDYHIPQIKIKMVHVASRVGVSDFGVQESHHRNIEYGPLMWARSLAHVGFDNRLMISWLSFGCLFRLQLFGFLWFV